MPHFPHSIRIAHGINVKDSRRSLAFGPDSGCPNAEYLWKRPSVLQRMMPADLDRSFRVDPADLPGEAIIFGSTPAMREIRSKIDCVLSSDLPVLIQGESGTGKEVIARFLHTRSDRHDAPFVKLNCAAIPASLLESELFGYESCFDSCRMAPSRAWAAAKSGVGAFESSVRQILTSGRRSIRAPFARTSSIVLKSSPCICRLSATARAISRSFVSTCFGNCPVNSGGAYLSSIQLLCTSSCSGTGQAISANWKTGLREPSFWVMTKL